MSTRHLSKDVVVTLRDGAPSKRLAPHFAAHGHDAPPPHNLFEPACGAKLKPFDSMLLSGLSGYAMTVEPARITCPRCSVLMDLALTKGGRS